MGSRTQKGLILVVAMLAAAAGFCSASPATAATFTVTSDADTDDGSCVGECTLREAITAANATLGTDTIRFAIGTGQKTIQIGSALPTVADTTVIDASTQPRGGLPSGRPIVELRGTRTASGCSAASFDALTITASQFTLRGFVINGFCGNNAIVLSGDGSRVVGNYIGTDVSGSAPFPNLGPGIKLVGASDAIIGGLAPGDRNVISGNTGDGILAEVLGPEPSSGHLIRGNFIGTDATGTQALPNGVNGIDLQQTSEAVIGGPSREARNVISGNAVAGVAIANNNGSGDNRIQGNYIGTDVTGRAALGNGASGVDEAAGGSGEASNGRDVVGGLAPGAGNVISANRQHGVRLIDTGDIVQGNLIGTDATGRSALGNGTHGVALNNADDTLIGGTEPHARNVISSNGTPDGPENVIGNGVELAGDSSHTRIEGNLIGTDITGQNPLGNDGFGVNCCGPGGQGRDRFGGTDQRSGNVIAFNRVGGVAIGSGERHSVLGNSIHSNGSATGGALDAFLGIVLVNASQSLPLWPTPNDPGDGDLGPNQLQNFPVVREVQVAGGSTTVRATLNSHPNRTYRVEFFSNRECDPLHFREGETFLGARDVTTDATGNVRFSATFPVALAASEEITTTATDPDGNTSEFSACPPDTATGTLVVVKQTEPDGEPTMFDFAGDASGAIRDGQQIAVPNLAPGTYRVTESLLTGWDLRSIACTDSNSSGDPVSGVATFIVEAGETVRCTFINTKRGRVVIEKQTDPDGSPGSFSFIGVAPGSIGDGGELIAAHLRPGTFSVQEVDPTADFDLQAIACSDQDSSGDLRTRTAVIRVEPGESVRCVFTNKKRPILPPNRPPTCTATAGPDLLWPPNHKYRLINIGGASDPDGDRVTLRITGVTQDEPLNDLGDGNTAPDAKRAAAAGQVYVRAERSGRGDGRVYRIVFTGSDGKGGTCAGTATVGVPHDRGHGKTPVDSAPPSYNSFG